MANNLYAIVVVLFRLVGVYYVLNAVFNFVEFVLVTTSHEPPWLALVIPAVIGIALWLLAKPMAKIITRDI